MRSTNRTCDWLRGRDLNPRPSGYEPDELPGCSTPRLEIRSMPRERASANENKKRTRFLSQPLSLRKGLAETGGVGNILRPPIGGIKIQRSSVVERSAVNRLVVGSNPTAGGISFRLWAAVVPPNQRSGLGCPNNYIGDFVSG
jgi:hypothetical protein